MTRDAKPNAIPSTRPNAAHDPLARWRSGVNIRPILPDLQAHSLHSYFAISPESPDGRRVLLFTSDRPDGQVGQLVMVDRHTAQTTVLDPHVEVEDAHRQANQQWMCNGQAVVYMSLVGGQWQIIRINTQDLSRHVLAIDRQLGWGQPHLDVAPLYGLHWNPGKHRDLEMLNVATGRIGTVLTADRVIADHRAFAEKLQGGGDRPMSIFFPQLSPNGRRVFFKLAVPDDGLFRSPAASRRDGLLVYDLPEGRSRGVQQFWGHPAWYADSRHVQTCQFVVDTDTMHVDEIPNIPMPFGGVHTSPSPDGAMLVTDISKKDYLPQRNHWTILMIDPRDGHYDIMHIAPAPGDGTTSWRPVHPHPAFTRDGRRVYFNVPQAHWTTLHVMEVPA